MAIRRDALSNSIFADFKPQNVYEMGSNDCLPRRERMDLSLANTEGFFRFHDFLESFDRSMKVTIGALGLAGTMAPSLASSTGSHLIKLPVGDEPWGKDTRWRSLDSVVKNSQLFVAQMGLMQVFSAFEDFLISSKAEHDRLQSVLNGEQSIQNRTDSAEDIGLRRLCNNIGLSLSKVGHALPLFDYFVAMRNCLAHRSGRASHELVEMGSLKDVQTAFENWPRRTGRPIPVLPDANYGKTIPLFARHSIFAGMVCRSIARAINDHQIAQFGDRGLVLMAAHHSLLTEDPTICAPRRNAEAVVNEFLCGRYRVRMDHDHEASGILKELDLSTACRDRYKRLYGKPRY
jgi:hypothetical protein